jgi:hypothetical protein
MRLSATRRACSKRTPLREATCTSCSSYDAVDADDRSLGCRGCSLTSRLKIKKIGRAEFCAPLASHSALLAHVTPFACALAGKDFAVAWLSYLPLAGFPDEATPAKTPAVFYIPHFP